MVKKVVKATAVVLLVAGLALLAYPHVSQWLYDRSAGDLIQGFDEQMAGMRTGAEGGEKMPPYLPELYAAMQAYNQGIYENGQDGFKDAWSYQPASFDLSQWGFADNMAGYIHIPRMNVKLPLYLGASKENMKKGAVHLTETSLPIGGENTNCVIAAHRGYSGAAMFRDIEKLQVGDEVFLTNLWETLTYRVVETKVIRPNDVREVLIQPGRDLVTLITCHPYRHNYQRYVVYCERIDQ